MIAALYSLARCFPSEVTPGAFDYLRPDGLSYYRRPDGSSYYTRP